jgi:integrase
MTTKRETTTITVFTRHGDDCPKKDNPQWKRCGCRKSLYVYEDGKVRYLSAKTRSWDQAERLAQAERDKRDPVKKRLQEIEAEAAQKAALQAARNITVTDATERWLRSLTRKTPLTEGIRRCAARRIRAWATDQGIEYVRDVTPDALDLWRGTWAPDAAKRYSRMGQTTQSQFQGRLKGFFRWCLATGNLDKNPSALLNPIPINDERTQPLPPAQFERLLAAIEPFTMSAGGDASGYVKELRALFLLQRYAGLRIIDCLMLPRTGLVDNRLSLVTKKTSSKIENRVLPKPVVSALNDLSPGRPAFRPGYFLWNANLEWDALSSKWDKIICRLRAHLDLSDEEGKPMSFRSHMLRDTYAVELLKAGVPLEDVSKLLTHTSIATTERHYAPWVKSRLQQLEDKSVAAMRAMGVEF